MAMTLYMNPVSTACRPVSLLIAEKKLPVTEQFVDLMKGEHRGAAFTAINPCRLVPVLEDGDFRIAESSAILKYLASRFEVPEYPKDVKQRAKVDEAMDWFNTAVLPGFRLRTPRTPRSSRTTSARRPTSNRARLNGARTRQRLGWKFSTSTCWARTTTSPTTESQLPTTLAPAWSQPES